MVKHKQDVNDNDKIKAGFEGFAQLKEADFDGHTDFRDMTFEQKLTWLSEAVVSVYRLAKDNPEASCNALFKKSS